MRPEEVPAELVEAAKVAVREQVEAAPGHVSDRLAERIARAALAAVLPETQAQAWDACATEAHDSGWTHDFGRDDLIARNPYRAARLREGGPSCPQDAAQAPQDGANGGDVGSGRGEGVSTPQRGAQAPGEKGDS